mmetsp:Transcript_4997/g.7635  ORF Transcript_4997/g.7635 Transcript_4997/m.7635 type:complete len:251 (-) Transcript_4997:201-953(-)|eukprot:CAMPEP_0185031072 /NCGR_PEP_ID=MMETSP1103-20130426/18337_1 /TAXON_ID=36769 /ORGANISM="Paraphysomonas bandaiensis, Strain Caron Lab Isolate" /LENGTH=250 /DNA_ID=CAMNT_0027566451 /DNA_START=17 /DNA_END=769 /DNA_ORIENTATION=-
MIHNVLLMATSGLVLFSKEFVNSVAQPRLIGSLLTAMIEFSQQTSGMQVSYIELSNVAITLVTNDVAKVFCALFHDRDDGCAFGRLICSEILNAFTTEYSSDLTNFGLNLKDFHGFHNKIADIIRNSVKPVLYQLQYNKGILKALLVTEDGTVASPNPEIDQLGVLANLQALTGLCTDIMANVDDDCIHIMLDSSHNSRLLLWRIQERSLLIVVVSKLVHSSKYRAALEEALDTIEQVCLLMTNLHLVSR